MKIKNLKLKILLLQITYYILLVTPVYAQVDISEKFGFGDITSLGEGTSRLVAPIFSIALALVLLYFLFGAFKYLRAGGNKEDVEGARQMIEHSIFGFILLIFAFLVLQFLLSRLFNITDFQIIK